MRPLCLFTALGFDEVKGNEGYHSVAQVSRDVRPPQAEIWHTSSPQLQDQLTQTETQMQPIQELRAIIGQIERDLVEKLTPLLQPLQQAHGSNEARVNRHTIAVHEGNAAPPDPLAVCEGPRTMSLGGTAHVDAQGVCSSVSSRNPQRTRDGQKHQRRNPQRLELERMMGLV